MPVQSFALASAALSVLGAHVGAAEMSLKTEFAGNTFFNGFYYNASATDPFNYGNIHYVDEDVATSQELTYVNEDGNAIIKVDNTTDGQNWSEFGRNSVLIISNDAIQLGELIVMDSLHVPAGCSVWPAFWTLDDEVHESKAGEIDIYEAVNGQTTGGYYLHTDTGCELEQSDDWPFDNSTIEATDCDYRADGNTGCGFHDDRNGTAGASLNEMGGGVHALHYAEDAIRIWFFPRGSIPEDLSSGSPDPDSWSEPQGSWPSSGCEPEEYFTNQHLILNINICGSFAGNDEVFGETCDGTCTDLVSDPSNYDDAYYEIQYIRIYGDGSNSTSSSAASGSGQNSNTDTSAAQQLLAVAALPISLVAGAAALLF